MARQDIANMLTGMGGGSTRPNPNMSSSDWRMAFGAQQAQGLMNAAGTTSPQEAIQMGIGNLNLESVKGLQTLAQMQQIRGDMAGAAQTVSQIKAMQEKEAGTKQILNTRKSIIERLEGNPKFENVLPLINSGVFDGDFTKLMPLLMPENKGSSMIKPFAAVDGDGKDIMLTVTSKEGQNDAVTLIDGSPAPIGSTMRMADGTVVNVDLGEEANGEFVKYLGRARGTQVVEDTENAKATLLTMQVIQDQWDIITSEAGVFTGMGAEAIQLPLSKLLMKAGLISQDTENAVANTEVFIANSGNLVAEVIKNFGAGTGLSDADREFAKGIVGGTVALNEASLKRLIKIQARASMRKIRMHNKNIKTLPAGVQGWGLDVDEPKNYDWAFEEDAYDLRNKENDGKAWDFNSVGDVVPADKKRPASVQKALDKYKTGAN